MFADAGGLSHLVVQLAHLRSLTGRNAREELAELCRLLEACTTRGRNRRLLADAGAIPALMAVFELLLAERREQLHALASRVLTLVNCLLVEVIAAHQVENDTPHVRVSP